MAWRKESARWSLGIGMALGVAALNLVPAPRDAAAESRSGGLPRLEFEAPPGLPPQPVVVPGTLRGVMGYRLPLVSRQQVPGQVVSGVLIPAHTTYVILQPGRWELVGLSPTEVEALRAAARADKTATQSEPAPRGWNLLRLFRKNKTPAHRE